MKYFSLKTKKWLKTQIKPEQTNREMKRSHAGFNSFHDERKILAGFFIYQEEFYLLKYITKRLICLIPVLLGISLLTFSLSKLAPGDPAEIMLTRTGIEPTAQLLQQVRAEMGLDKPVYLQYTKWIADVVRGDLGKSLRTGTPVAQELLHRLPATFQLTLVGLLVTVLMAFPLGILSAVYKNSWVDHLSRTFSFLFASLPSYWLGLLLIYYLAVQWNLLSVMGKKDFSDLIMPGLTLGLGMAATYTRLLRASVLEVLGQDFIMAARARGLKESLVILRNALKYAFLSVITLLGMSLGHLLGGTVIVENIFAWPGVGRYAMEAIFSRDYPVIQGYVLWMALIFVGINLLVDISYRLIDPRIRLGER